MKHFATFTFLSTVFLLWSNSASAQIVTPGGKFIHFNGVDQRMVIPNHSDLNISAGESYTITCRVSPDNFDSQYSIISKGNFLIPGARFELYTSKSPSVLNLGFTLQNSDNIKLGAWSVASLEAGRWVHLAWVYQAGEKSSRIYVNGELMSTVSNNVIGRSNVINSLDLTVGCGSTDATDHTPFQYWPGQFDELRIWKRALSGYELLADRTDLKAGSNGLVAAYDFENITNNIVPDVSGKGHSGQVYGYGIRVVPTRLPVGIGEINERLVAFRIIAESAYETVKCITVNLVGTKDFSDVTTLKAYYNGSAERLNLKTARLFGSSAAGKDKTSITGDLKLAVGDNYFWITADISSQAREGNPVVASVVSYTTGTGAVITVPYLPGSRTILLANKLLFSGGDAGSKHYRIPSIVTARDGSLVTATDKRWNFPYDLPNHIDVVIRRSTDNGRSWSDPRTIAGEGINTGFGDPALVLNRKNGEIICLFAANKGFFYSTAAAPIRIYQSKSSDNGVSWSTPQDITPQIYGVGSLNPPTQTWQGAFVASGAATQLKSGRLMAAIAVRENATGTISNYVIYSDDNAQTWKASVNRATTNGNEAKLVELDNGNLLMSIRNPGTRLFNISKDRGMTWGVPYLQPAIKDPYCNGDMIRYTSVSRGYNKNRLLHSIPYANSRKNVSVLLSYDEGSTWPVRKTIYPDISGYSSLTVMNDGTIGIYYEVGEYDLYQMYFVRFSLDWLSDGTDTWKDKRSGIISATDEIAENPAAVTVYPNPAEGVVNITGPLVWNSLIEIFNTQGTLMISRRFENPGNQVQLSVQSLSPGVYFIRINGIITKLVVK